MNAIEIARRLVDLKQVQDARAAYCVALQEESLTPTEEFEAASYIFFSQGDYQISFTTFVSLFNRGEFQAEILDLMSQAFYIPNLKARQKQYEKNCKVLRQYPYFFRQNFPAFEDLPICFFPFDDHVFVPYYPAETRFGDYVNFDDSIIDRYFFKDLEKPVLAEDVYSQYQLEYLNDNVRKSEWVARENHIYLHYTDWMTFCAYLQVLDYKKILKDAKFVFFIEDEVSRYPIDFQKEYGIDYTQYPVKPYDVREFHRLIWHTQLSAHNGGDFFNEVFYGHPNLLACDSLIFETIEELADVSKTAFKEHMVLPEFEDLHLERLNRLTDKDVLVAFYLKAKDASNQVDPSARIIPAIFFQPHFYNLNYELRYQEEWNGYVMECAEMDTIYRSPIFEQFKYIKTFTPMRRPTTSYAATIRYMMAVSKQGEDYESALPDELSERMVNRSFMVDPWNRLYHDSRLVRFEDGKLNSKATFIALAEFLDLPYTESMTYCSNETGVNPDYGGWNVAGFNPESVYRTYDDFCNDDDRALLEYAYRDVYEKYGYDFHYYHGEPVDDAWIEACSNGAETLDRLMKETRTSCLRFQMKDQGSEEEIEKSIQKDCETAQTEAHNNRIHIAKAFQNEVRLINTNGQPLQFMTPLKLAPELLEGPLYH